MCITPGEAPDREAGGDEPPPRVRLIVVESRARWPPPALVPPRTGEPTLVIGRGHPESPRDLARRVLRTVLSVAGDGQHVGYAVIVVEPRLCDESMTARHVIARALVEAVRSAGGYGGLDLIVDGESNDELRQAIMDLAELLVLSSAAPSPSVRVRFGPGTAGPTVRKSGLHRAENAPGTDARRAAGAKGE